MLPNNFTPLNQTQWRQAQRYTPLPIMPTTKQAFKQELNKQQVNFNTLAKIAEQDPALCWHLQRNISQQAHSKQHKINSAYQCLSLLGMQPIVNLVKNLPAISMQDNYAQNYIEQLQTSVFCARLSYDLALKTQPSKTQHIYWYALLSRAPLWRLSMQYPEFTQLFNHLLSKNINLIQANKQVFGENSSAQWLELAKCMRLPQAVIELYDQKTWLELKSLKQLRKQDPRQSNQPNKALLQKLQEVSLILQSTSGLTHSQLNAPQYARSFRWIALNAHVFGQQPSQILQQVRQTQLDFAHQGLHLSALGLDKLTAPCLPAPMFHVTQTHQTKHTTANSLKSTSIDYLYNLINQFQQPKTHFKNWLSLMQAILNGIEQGLNLPIGAILLKNQTNTFISTHYSLDTPANESIKNLKVSHQTEGIIQKLMKQQSIIQITPNTHLPYLQKYADNVQQRIPKQSCLMSIHAGADPIGIVLCANEHANQPISPQQLQAFKALCLKASLGLTELKRKRSASQ